MKKLTVAFVNAVLLTRTEFYVSFRSRNESTHGAWIFSVIMKSFMFEIGYQIMFIFRINLKIPEQKANDRID